jgi:arginine N-succinyltransferase
MFLIREVYPQDLDGLHAVAEHLNTVNLPGDRAVLEQLIDRSQKSFAGTLKPPEREYIFALFDGDRLIGTSMVHAQHGTRRAPHIFFDVISDERYSESLDRHIVHTVLRIGYNYAGPTEIGGLILLPEYRRHEFALGRWLSYVRFLYIAQHRNLFREEVLSELLPPLEPDGTSLLWESLGRHFTNMSYQEADRVSKTNKEFIRTLFPQEPIYTCLLPKKVQELIGVVGPETRGVEKMLRKIGFDYAQRIDPFDGGPHFIARTDDITVVKETRRATVVAVDGADDGRPFGLVCVERDRAPRFAATGSRFRLEGKHVGLPESTRQVLGVAPGDEVGVLTY